MSISYDFYEIFYTKITKGFSRVEKPFCYFTKDE